MEPCVSVAMEKGTSPPPTAAADPLELSPVQAWKLNGLWQMPVWEALYVSKGSMAASSIIASLPSNTAPQARNFAMASASRENCLSANGVAPQLVGRGGRVANISLTAKGIP